MKSYLLNMSYDSWRKLINLWRDMNDYRKKRKLKFVHKSTLFRLAVEWLLTKTPQELSDIVENAKLKD